MSLLFSEYHDTVLSDSYSAFTIYEFKQEKIDQKSKSRTLFWSQKQRRTAICAAAGPHREGAGHSPSGEPQLVMPCPCCGRRDGEQRARQCEPRQQSCSTDLSAWSQEVWYSCLREEMALWLVQALHSWHTGWSSPRCHHLPFLHPLMSTPTKALLLPGKGSCCLLRGLLRNGHDPLVS